MKRANLRQLQQGDWISFDTKTSRKILYVLENPKRYVVACHDRDWEIYGEYTVRELQKHQYKAYRLSK